MPKTPPDFRLDPMPVHLAPSPTPPRTLKRQVYADPSVFKNIDQHAINEARTNYRNFRDLIWHLVFKKELNQLDKVRCIFRWMTTKNMFTIMFDTQLPNSPEELMAGFKDGKTTYAKIFECLCLHAGLYCVTVSGWAKGVEYRPGQAICNTPINHSWNAVYINGDWQLVDSHWATRYLQSERNTPENLVYEYDDFYFLTEPYQLIFSHCPEEVPWQLLHPACSRSQFEDFPLVKSYFFSVGMEFLQQRQGVIKTKNGLLTITLGYKKPASFTFKLTYGDTMLDNVNGIPLKRYAIQETTENRVTLYFRAPREGNYFLTVFAQQAGDRLKEENIFKAACEYKIICEKAVTDLRPYPKCSDSNWGPGLPVQQYSLVPSHKTAILPIPRSGVAEVGFRRSRDVRIHPKLVKDGMDDAVLERCVDVKEQDDMIYVTLRLPAAGEYGLEIYANEPVRDGDTYTHVCQYLCSHLDRDFSAQYGQVYDRADLTALTDSSSTQYQGGQGQGGFGSLSRDGQLRTGPGGKQSTSQEWGYSDSRGYSEQMRQDNEAMRYGSHPELRQTTSRLDSLSMAPGGMRQAPPGGTLPKTGRAQFGSVDDLPPPPADLQGGANRRPGGTEAGPIQRRASSVDIVYLKPGTPSTGSQENLGVQVTYVNPVVRGAGGVGGTGTIGPGGTMAGPGGVGSDGIRKQPVEVENVPSPIMQRKQEGSGRQPVEVNYVPSPTLGRKAAGEGVVVTSNVKRDPVEMSFVTSSSNVQRTQGMGDSSDARRMDGRHPAPATLPKPGKKKGADGLGRSQEDLSGSQDKLNVNKDGQENQGTEEPFPPPPPELTGTGGTSGNVPSTRYIPVQIDKTSVYDRSKLGVAPDHFRQNKVTDVSGGLQGQMTGAWSGRLAQPDKEYQPHPQKMYTSSVTISAPQDFKPVPVKVSVEKPAAPTVAPKPFKDISVFESVDTHAVEVSKERHKNFTDLVWHLIFARKIEHELEKARAIFLWLCSKDLSNINFNNVQIGSPEEILVNLRDGKTTYAVVYETLCSYAGLQCKTITGYAKGAEYKPGMEFTGTQGQHSWNAVRVDGTWRLVDCHWAARRLVGKKITAENIRYELDEYYFMPDPYQLIFTHFPDDNVWQLLPQPIGLKDFEQLVPVKSAFFKYELQILSHRQAVVPVDQEVTIIIACPPTKAKNLAFTFTLGFDDGLEEWQGLKLNRFGMQEMVDECAYFSLRPPQKGLYRLIIYAKDMTTSTKEGVYGGVCEYELNVTSAIIPAQPFPPCVHTSWGPGDGAAKYQLQPLQSGAIFSTVAGTAEVRFRMPRELRFTAKLKSNKEDEKALQPYLLHRVIGKELAVFTVYLPHDGEYGLEIYANDPAIDGNSLFHAYQYLIICMDSIVNGPEVLPVMPPGYLGPQPMMNQLGLTASSHVDPFIQTNDPRLAVVMNTTQPVRMTSQLLYASQGRSDELSDFILQQGGQGQVLFQVLLSRPGFYKLQLYGLPFHDTSESLPGVFNYLIIYNPPAGVPLPPVLPYPKQFGQWKEGCYLFAPQQGKLSVDLLGGRSTLTFKLEVPTAKSVAVVVGEDWAQLERGDNGSGPWEGEVPLANKFGHENKLAVCANYGQARDSYSTLLDYTLA